MTATRFERVTYRLDGRTRTVRLEVTKETDLLLAGYQVDRDGTRIAPSSAYLRERNAEDGLVLHVISKDLITGRVPLVDDLHYGTGLIPATTESDPTSPNRSLR